jgi:hypothetical protein
MPEPLLYAFDNLTVPFVNLVKAYVANTHPEKQAGKVAGMVLAKSGKDNVHQQ